MMNGPEVGNAETSRLIDGGRFVSAPRRGALVRSGTAVQAIDLAVTTLKRNFKEDR